ncbi:gustatory receptor [Homalodisca vitripennis]|nr:gustatory receptor [Homalodisca vitripennis]
MEYKMSPLSKEVLIFSQIFGGFPLTSTVGNKKLKFSLPVFLWGLVLTILQVLTTEIGLYTDYRKKLAGVPLRMFEDISTIVVVLDFVSLNLMSVVIFISFSRKHEQFINIFDILEKVDKKIRKYVPEVNAKAKVLLVFIVIIILITGIVVLDFQRSFYAGNKDYISSLCYIPPLIMLFSQASLFLHFTQVAQSIATRFGIIKSRVKEEVLRNRRDRPMSTRYLRTVNVPHNNKGLYTIHEVESLMSAFWMLCDAVHQANSLYGDQLLSVFFTSLVHITISLYYLIGSVILRHSTAITVLGGLAIAHIAHLVLLVRPSTLVAELADGMAPMVCKLINTSLDPILVNRLEEFLLQLGKRKSRFSALGFFQLQTSAVIGMAGAVTTYLVVLIHLKLEALPSEFYKSIT